MGSWGSRPLRDPIPRISITRTTKAGRSLRPGGRSDAAEKSNSATDAAGLERLGLCIVGLKQPSASHDQTTEAVALRKRRSSRRERRSSRAAPRPRTLDGRSRQRGRWCSQRSTAPVVPIYARPVRRRSAAHFRLSLRRRAAVVARDRADKASGCRSRTIEAPAAQPALGVTSGTSAPVGSTSSTSVAAQFRPSSPCGSGRPCRFAVSGCTTRTCWEAPMAGEGDPVERDVCDGESERLSGRSRRTRGTRPTRLVMLAAKDTRFPAMRN
jgi:hypothetical protein